MRNLILATLLAFASCTPVAAQQPGDISQNCGDRDRVITALQDKFGEQRQSIGMAPNNLVVEVWANESTGTWTVLATRADGRSCLIASGKHYEKTDEAGGKPT